MAQNKASLNGKDRFRVEVTTEPRFRHPGASQFHPRYSSHKTSKAICAYQNNPTQPVNQRPLIQQIRLQSPSNSAASLKPLQRLPPSPFQHTPAHKHFRKLTRKPNSLPHLITPTVLQLSSPLAAVCRAYNAHPFTTRLYRDPYKVCASRAVFLSGRVAGPARPLY